MICSISASAIAWIGFSGTMFRSVSLIGGASWISGFSAASPIVTPSPGAMILASSRPMVIATAVVSIYRPMVFTPIRPSFRGSAIPAAPAAMEKKTKGTTIILIALMNSSAMGSKIYPLSTSKTPGKYR